MKLSSPRALLIRALLPAVLMLIALSAGSMALSRSDDFRCLTVSTHSNVGHHLVLDTAYGWLERQFDLNLTVFDTESPDGRYHAVVSQHPNETLQLRVSGTGIPTRIIRTGGKRVSFLSAYLLWSPDSRSFAYLWLDSSTEQVTLSIYDVKDATEQTIPYATEDATVTLYWASALNWSGDSRILNVQERTSKTSRFRFFTASPLAPLTTLLDEMQLMLVVWSPTGSDLAVLETGTNLLHMGTLNEPLRSIRLGLSRPELQGLLWSPDGEYFVVISHLSQCMASLCDISWRYDLYRRDGTLIAGYLPGLHELTSDPPVQTLMGMWYGEQWIWVEQSDSTAPINVAAFNARTREQSLLARDLVRGYVQDIFYTPSQQDILPNAWVLLRLPHGERLAVPTRDNRHINVDLLELSTGTTTRLVSGADTLSRPGERIGSAFWRDDGRSVQVLWSRRGESNRQTYLTMLNLDSGSLYSTAEGATHILAPTWIDESRIAFINQVGSRYAFTLFDVATGEQRDLTDLPNGVTRWEGVIKPDGAWIAARVTISSRSSGIVYLAALDGSAAVEVSRDAAQTPVWSPDGKHLAFLTFDGTNAGLRFATADGQVMGVYPLQNASLLSSTVLDSWTRCDPDQLRENLL